MKIRYPILIWASAVSFYVYQFILRVSPNVLQEELMESYHITAHGFGQLSAVAMYFYAIFQFPLGSWTDRYGVRKILLSSIFCCVFGTFLFSYSENIYVAYLGRAFIGGGSAGSFLCVSKLICELFPLPKRAQFFGLSLMAGTIGALSGTMPLTYLHQSLGWRTSLAMTGVLGCVILLANYFLVIDPKTTWEKSERPSFLETFRLIGKRCSWQYFTAGVGIYLPVCVFGDVWGVSFIKHKYQVDTLTASQTTSLMYLGLCLGSIGLPFIKKLPLFRKRTIAFSLWAIFIFQALFLYLPVSLSVATGLLFLVGFFAGAEILCFDGACAEVHSELSASVTGLLNGSVMLIGALLQEQIGRALDYLSREEMQVHLPHFGTATAFIVALSMIMPLLFLSALSTLGLKELENS